MADGSRGKWLRYRVVAEGDPPGFVNPALRGRFSGDSGPRFLIFSVCALHSGVSQHAGRVARAE